MALQQFFRSFSQQAFSETNMKATEGCRGYKIDRGGFF